VPRLGGNLTTVVYSSHCHFEMDWNFSRLIGNHFSTSCKNLVRFGPVTPEFKTQEFVQPASIILLWLV